VLRIDSAPYSHLTSSDFFLLSNMKKRLAGKRFGSNIEVNDKINLYFKGLKKSYCTGIKKLSQEYCWNKRIKLNEDYVEK